MTLTVVPREVTISALRCRENGDLEEIFCNGICEDNAIVVHCRNHNGKRGEWISNSKRISIIAPEKPMKVATRYMFSMASVSTPTRTVKSASSGSVYPAPRMPDRSHTTLHRIPLASLRPRSQFARAPQKSFAQISAAGLDRLVIHMRYSDGDRLVVLSATTGELVSQRHIIMEKVNSIAYDRSGALWFTVIGRRCVYRLSYPDVDEMEEPDQYSLITKIRDPGEIKVGETVVAVACSLEKKLWILDKNSFPECTPLCVISELSEPHGFAVAADDIIYVRRRGGHVTGCNRIGELIFCTSQGDPQAGVPPLVTAAIDQRFNLIQDSDGAVFVWEESSARKVIYPVGLLRERHATEDHSVKRVNSERVVWRSLPINKLPRHYVNVE